MVVGNQNSGSLHTGSGAFSPSSVYRLTFPIAAMMDSEIPACRDFMESRNSRISRRTLSFSLHTHAIGRNPWAAAYSLERVSLTYIRGRIKRTLPFCDCATGGSEAIRPLKRMFLKSDSAESSDR